MLKLSAEAGVVLVLHRLIGVAYRSLAVTDDGTERDRTLRDRSCESSAAYLLYVSAEELDEVREVTADVGECTGTRSSLVPPTHRPLRIARVVAPVATVDVEDASQRTRGDQFVEGSDAWRSPEGKADVLDVKGVGNFSARLFIDSKTHLPLMLSWTTPPNLVPVVAGQKPPANLPPGAVTFETPMPPPDSATPEEKKQFEEQALAARKTAMASARPTENRIYYADYRDVDGLKLPFRIRRAVGATTVEETTFDRYRMNAKIDPRKFEVRK